MHACFCPPSLYTTGQDDDDGPALDRHRSRGMHETGTAQAEGGGSYTRERLRTRSICSMSVCRPAGTVSHSQVMVIVIAAGSIPHACALRRQHRHHRVPALPLPPAISFHCGPLHTLYYPVLYIFWLSITILHVPSTLALQNQQLIVN
jgi:hypothetical protein